MAKSLHVVDRFETWGEFLEYCRNGKTLLSDDRRASRRHHDKSWAGVKSFDEAMQLGLTGWEEGEVKSKALSQALFARIVDKIEREEIVYDVEGSGIDVAKFLNNEPECWQRFDSVIKDGPGNKQIRLVFNGAASAGVDAKVIEARGAAIASLVELLEFSGHRVELVVGFTAAPSYSPKGTPPVYETYIKVKDASQDLDRSRVVYALAHPSMLRVLWFSCAECTPKDINDSIGANTSGGYGKPTYLNDKGDIYIDRAFLGEPDWKSPASAEKWVLEQLEKQGVKLHKDWGN